MIWRMMFFAVIAFPVILVLIFCQLVALGLRTANWHFFPILAHRLLGFALGLEIRQIGHPAKGKPTLILSNHISWMDIPAIGSLAPLSFVAKTEVGRWPLVAFLAGLQKTIYVDRQRKTDTGRAAGEMGRRMADGHAVVLFAEGTSDVGLHVLPFRSALVGATRMAMQNDDLDEMYIQPMAIAYTHLNGLPISSAERSKIAWIGNMGIGDNIFKILGVGVKSVSIMFGEPISVKKGSSRKIVTLQAEESVRQMLVSLNRQTELPTAHTL